MDISGWSITIDDINLPLSEEIPTTAKHISIISPDQIQQDEFLTDFISPNYSYCRISSEVFQICTNTKGTENQIFTPSPKKVLPNLEGLQILSGCVIYTDDSKNSVFSDGEFAIPIQCKDCEVNKCYTAEINYDNKIVTKIFSERILIKKQNILMS